MAKRVPRTKRSASKAGKPKAPRPARSAVAIQLRPVGRSPIQVNHLAKPPKVFRPKGVHPRHLLPLIREGKERQFHSATGQVSFHGLPPMALAHLAATDDVALVTSTELSQPGKQQVAATVGEPSTAMNGQVVVYTGNWYAAVSSDGGQTFQFINPATEFPAPDADTTFCCDQVVQYIAKIDTFVWLLQYGPSTGDNIQRLAFAKTADVVNGKWRLFDITTQSLGVPGAFLDFPDLAVGANSLYVTTNIFASDGGAGSAVIRIPVSSIPSGSPSAQRFVSMDLQSFRVAQDCGTTAFFAAHQDTSTLSVFSWDEGQTTPAPTAVGVARWIGGNGYQSRTPDGRRWLDRADPRITGATLAGSELWFAWSVDQGSNHRPNPFVQIARIDTSNMTLIDNINVFDPDSAIAYGALATNANDEVGISYAIGGGSRLPSHAVGILTGNRKDVVVASGDRGPLDPQSGKGEWGDYLTVRPVFPDRLLFAATGFTLKGAGDGSNQDATPRFVVFGRSGDVAAGPAGADGKKPPPHPVVGPPAGVQDVNLLPVVSRAVAAQIKAACGITGFAAPAVLPPAAMLPQLITKPGVERWPVKTGTDPDQGKVGQNVIKGRNLGAGIVETTVEELISAPRPADMANPTGDFPAYQSHRADPLETVIWRMDVTINALKQETDGDYHLVLQGASGETMIGEIPTPRPPFVNPPSPWLANLQVARKAVDDKLVSPLNPAAFVPLEGKLVPRAALSVEPQSMPPPTASLRTPEEGDPAAQQAFKTQVPPTRARITGVGFFDKVHGQMGVSQSNGIELHPVLKIEWL
jgi:hypothetical protein